ncbi:MAG: NADH-quinone oxidoreductase subunit J [Bacteroides sp.]|nr:NADH-quinone oxidoreductase subunit J [Bacteroidales bacterium]MBD5317317.1 NADH-quinone oxidoreductase subunit J [Bacteroides sp.]MBD5377483.1 NADH-quinone oxidoreductase subunit J [Bacteroides sp.]
MESLGSSIAYWIIVLSIVIFSVLTVTTRKILRAATFLLFTLFATAAVYFKLDYEFLGTVQIAVYAGGIVVLFVFSILLTTHPGDNSKNLAARKRGLGLLAAILTLIVTGYAFVSRCSNLCAALPEAENPTMHKIGETLMGTGHGQYLLPFEAISVLLLACIIGGVVVARKR